MTAVLRRDPKADRKRDVLDRLAKITNERGLLVVKLAVIEAEVDALLAELGDL